MIRYIAMLLLLAGCGQVSKDLGTAGKSPGILVCAGKGSISVVGQAAIIYGANGSITIDCGSGMYIGQGLPASTLPNMPSASSPIVTMPTLGQAPSTGGH